MASQDPCFSFTCFTMIILSCFLTFSPVLQPHIVCSWCKNRLTGPTLITYNRRAGVYIARAVCTCVAVHTHRRRTSPNPQKTFKKFSMLSIFKNLGQLFTYDIGIDLGTSSVLVYVKGKGMISREPSVVAVNVYDNNPIAYGEEARKMIGRTPDNIKAIKPLKHGVISNITISIYIIIFITIHINCNWITINSRPVINLINL